MTYTELNPNDRLPICKSISGTNITLVGIETAYNLAAKEYNDHLDACNITIEESGDMTEEQYAIADKLSEEVGTLQKAMIAIKSVIDLF